ncbi:hypothetical protein KIH27_20270 [Mycobacterium sp. M1]|uniref:Uncharacterized protein n=1 Tax=Mycolicibacter acidiphilus TaxID=2835306 RepID=A0ABS5RNN2_9MYCO|nr:hypothetical protein [Mycolicibacter acidiphilus]MBS9535922.1 hypothetical protein [Mycolicibacter acidiphilus]
MQTQIRHETATGRKRINRIEQPSDQIDRFARVVGADITVAGLPPPAAHIGNLRIRITVGIDDIHAGLERLDGPAAEIDLAHQPVIGQRRVIILVAVQRVEEVSVVGGQFSGGHRCPGVQ